MAKYIQITQSVSGISSWPAGTTRYYIYDDALTCAQAQTQFTALATMALKVSATTTAIPSSSYSKHWTEIICSDGAVNTEDTYVTADNADYVAPAGETTLPPDSGNSTTPPASTGTAPFSTVTAAGTGTYNGAQVNYITITIP